MKTTITTAQAMSHPDVALTINTLGAMADELREERDALKDAAKLALVALNGVVDFDPDKRAQWSVSGGSIEAHECNAAITALKVVL